MYTYQETDKNRELSKLLHDKGCVSESERYWAQRKSTVTGAYYRPDLFMDLDEAGIIFIAPAFTFEDVIRRENAMKIWGDKPGKETFFDKDGNSLFKKVRSWQHYTEELLGLYVSGEDWQQYIIDHLTVTTPPHL